MVGINFVEDLIISVKIELIISSYILFYFILLKKIEGKTGEYSIYTKFCGYEIMFHVSTLLPYYPNDPQQVFFLKKKKKIYNSKSK